MAHPTVIDPVSHLAERLTPEPNTGCWLWTGGVDRDGYGIVKIRGVSRRTHRLAWQFARGPIPAGLMVCHHCDTPACCNPVHLFLGTASANWTDMMAKGRGRFSSGDAHYIRRRPEVRTRGDRHGRRKLCESQVIQILDRLLKGERQSRIAAEFGLSKAAINLIALGRNWAHLPR